MKRLLAIVAVLPAIVFAYTTIRDEGFESGSLSGWWNDGGRGVVINTDAHSGTHCAKYTPAGASHFGFSPIAPFREAYLSFWVKFMGEIPCTNEPGCTPDGKHFWRFAEWPNHNVGLAHELDTGLRQGTYGIWFLSASVGFNVPSPFVKGQWGKQTVRVKLESAPGRGDGHFTVQACDKVLVNEHNANLYGTWAGNWDTFIFTNYDGITGYWLVDDFKLLIGEGAYAYNDGSPISDGSPPYLYDFRPVANTTNVATNAIVACILGDSGVGVDRYSLVMKVNGLQVSPTPTFTGSSPASYRITWRPTGGFAAGQQVSVTVDAKDLGSPAANMPTYSSSFTTAGGSFIHSVRAEPAAIYPKTSGGLLLDLQGRRVELGEKPLENGLYITHGQKGAFGRILILH